MAITLSLSAPSSQLQTSSFQDILSGDKAFYNKSDYQDLTRLELAQDTLLPTSYRWDTEYKIIRIAKQILSTVIFPLLIYKFFHSLVGKIVLPATRKERTNDANRIRPQIQLSEEWKYKRITIEVDGCKIDAAIMGKAATFNNGRWVLASNGNNELYENRLNSYDFKAILDNVNANALIFNYPGVGASSGPPNRKMMAKAYRAMLTFLEDKKSGIGATEIIGYGHSIGGGVQGDALNGHKLKNGIKYVFVKSRTFSDLSTLVSVQLSKLLGFLVKLFGWNMTSVYSSKKLQAPEIIMQTARVQDYEELKNSSKIIDDDVIQAKSSLAKALLDDEGCSKENKIFLGMTEHHNSPLKKPFVLTQNIEKLLKTDLNCFDRETQINAATEALIEVPSTPAYNPKPYDSFLEIIRPPTTPAYLDPFSLVADRATISTLPPYLRAILPPAESHLFKHRLVLSR